MVTEPWWHRNFRRLRSRARRALKTAVWKTWNKKKVRKALDLLQIHHGSRPPKPFLSTMSQRGANLQMSTMWTCRFCQVKHTCAQAHCESCNRHWKQADAATGQRSQSRRSRRTTRTNQERKKTANPNSNTNVNPDGHNKKPEDEELFTSKLPWVTSSPHGRAVPNESAKNSNEDGNNAMPVPPETKSLTVPAGPTSDEDVMKLHQHLKAVKATLGSLPEELEQKLVACEEKLREKALTHGHLNKLGKLNKQMKSLLTKLKDMDEGWQQFAQKVAAKFDHHRKLYHTSREAIMQEYLTKSQELQAAKEEVQVASQHLFSEQPVAPVVEQADDTARLLEQAIQEDATFEDARFDEYQTQAGTIEVDEDDELMPDFGQAKLSKTAIQPFARRVQTSPTKVANLHLKAKEVEKSKSPPTTK